MIFVLVFAQSLPFNDQAVATYHSNLGIGIDGSVLLPDQLITPSNQKSTLPESAIAGSDIPKNLIIAPACSFNCPPVIGTNKDDIIDASAVTDATIFGLDGNDLIRCGPGNCKAYGGEGNNFLVSGPAAHAQLYGGPGNNILVGGAGNDILVGGKGSNQFFAGQGNNILIGGKGSGPNFFDCGPFGTGIVINFNPAKGDTKSSTCKYVFTVPSQ